MPRRSLSEIEAFLHAQADRMRANPTDDEALLRKHLLVYPTGWSFQYPMILLGVRGKVHGVIFDFLHLPAKVAVELDGRQHKAGPDGRRDRAAAHNGILTLRFTNQRIRKKGELPKILEEIQTAVQGRLGQ
jgi:very-short-patch-repair endonuclease